MLVALVMSLAENLKHYRNLAALSQAELARMVGVRQNTIAAIESGKTQTTKYIFEIAAALGCTAGELDPEFEEKIRSLNILDRIDADWFIKEKVHKVPPYATKRNTSSHGAKEEASIDIKEVTNLLEIGKSDLPRDVPVLGISTGVDGADFTFNGNTIDYFRRPPGTAEKKSVYGLYVDSDSMWPRFSPGDPVYVDPNRRPANGEDAIIELHAGPGDIAGRGYIKRIVRRTLTKLIVEQFNPPREIEFDLSEIKSLHRVIPLMELIGF